MNRDGLRSSELVIPELTGEEKEELDCRVARGIRFLDAKVQGWRERVRGKNLRVEISNPIRCPPTLACGTHDFTHFLIEHPEVTDEDLIQMGFEIDGWGKSHGHEAHLNFLWTAVFALIPAEPNHWVLAGHLVEV